MYGTGKDVGVVTALGIQSLAVDADLALVDLVAREVAVVDDGFASTEGGAGGVDEGRAIDLNPRRIGDDDFGAVTRNFDVAVEQAGIAAVDLVDDDSCSAGSQPWVALDPAGGLGVGVGAAVVENRAIAWCVELLVLVHGDAARRRRLDVDLSRSAGGVEDGRLFGLWCIGIGNDGARLCRQNLCRTECEHERKYQRFDQRSGNAVAVAGGLRAFALAADDFGHHIHTTEAFVEDDFVCVTVHDVAFSLVGVILSFDGIDAY